MQQQQQQQQQPDSAAEARERKKMAQPAMLPRRGGSSSGAGLEDFPPGLLAQPPPPSPSPAASSSSASVSVSSCPPGAPPPQSLALLSQGAGGVGGPAGAQLKKKSGFQITSVTPAQISASLSSNNSIAEDTESYDDLDESHTEDFSSSEILDVSLSRATDLGEPERSSSEETLNNFHEADSPGAVSPNQPRGLAQQQQQQPPRGLTNGSAHPPRPHYAHAGQPQPPAHPGVPPPVSGGSPSSPSFRRLPVAAGSLEGARPGPVGASSVAALAGATVAHFHVGAASATGAVASAAGGRGRQVGKTLTNLPTAGNGMALPGGNVALSGGIGNGAVASSNASGTASHAATGATAAGHLQPAGSTTSRFRVVKLDSSSEPFKKGRWTCTEFYDKENPAAVAESTPVAKTMDALLDVASERESTSGSSVSSTLSHYTESVGSGEMGAPPRTQFQGVPQQMEYSSSSGVPPASAPGLPQSMSQSQLSQVQLHPQEVSYPPQKPGAAPPASAVPSPLTVVGGHQPTLPFTAPPAQPAVPVAAPQPQPLPFGQGQAQHPAALPPMPMQMAPGQHVKPVAQASLPEYIQPPQILPAPSLQPGAAIIGSGPAVPIAQPPNMQLPVQAHISGAPSQSVAQAQPAIPAMGAPAALMNVGQPGSVAPVAQRPSVANQMAPSVLAPSAAVPAPSQAASAGVAHPGSQSVPSGLPQTLGIPPPGNLMPMQGGDPLAQGMAQLPPVSPVPSASAAPVPGHSASSMPPAPGSLAPPKALGQPSSMHNGSLAQNVSQPALLSTGLHLPAAPNSSQFSSQTLAQSIASRTDEAKRPTAESILVGLTQPSESGGIGASLADGSMVSSLFPLKVLPLAALDGEEDSSSGASVVAIDNKIEQAMDLVKSHLMYAVREEVEVLKEQIKELIEKNNQLEQENNLLKTLASPEQLAQFQAQLQTTNSPAGSSQTQGANLQNSSQAAPQNSGPSA